MQKTVLVLGAGASKEVDLPIGENLKGNIADVLSIRVDAGRLMGSDSCVTEALRQHVVLTSPQRDVAPYIQASRRICQAMPQAPSIDNFINSHAGDAAIELCGKLAIVRCILAAERSSKLWFDTTARNPRIDLGALHDTWFNSIWRMLAVSNLSEIENRFRSMVIVNFNYDRCIEQYLFHAVQNYYGVDERAAAGLVNQLEIHHPYGTVGSLPWQEKPSSVDYGEDKIGSRDILQASTQIKTFTEGTDPTASAIASIRKGVLEARNLIFLGFAFHRQNLQLLWPVEQGMNGRGATCIGTAFQIQESDIVADVLSSMSGIDREAIALRDLTCQRLFDQHHWTLSQMFR